MQHEVFISHSSIDKTIANAICHTLEQNGITCWIAPRDVRSGYPYPSEIMQGIKACKVVVLIFSKNSNLSRHVLTEIEHAFSTSKVIIPFITDNTEMEDGLNYYLSCSHWLVAYPDYEERFSDLVIAVSNALGRHNAASSVQQASQGKQTYKPSDKSGVNQQQHQQPANDFDYEEGMALFDAGETEEALLPLLRSALNGKEEAKCTIENILVDQCRKLCDKCEEFWSLAKEESSNGNNFATFCHFFYLYASGLQYDEAFNAIRKVVSEEPRPAAYLMLGICYHWGLGTKMNCKLAMHYYTKAIEGGCRKAYSYMGQIYECGDEKTAKNTDKALELYRKGMNLGDKRSSRLLFEYYLYTKQDYDVALKVTDEMEQLGISGSLRAKGEICLTQGQEDEAYKYYMQALEKGETDMFANLAAYLYNHSCHDEARQMAQRGMAEGNAFATYLCGWFAEQDGNYAKAWDYYLTKYLRFGTSADDLGRLYLVNGYKPDNFDLDTLMEWLEKQAKNGGDAACTMYVKFATYRKFREQTLRYDLLRKLPETHDIIRIGSSYGLSDMKYFYGRLLCSRDYKLPNPIEGKRLIDEAAHDEEPLAVEWLLINAYNNKDDAKLKYWVEFAIDNMVFVNQDDQDNGILNALDIVLRNATDYAKLAKYIYRYYDYLKVNYWTEQDDINLKSNLNKDWIETEFDKKAFTLNAFTLINAFIIQKYEFELWEGTYDDSLNYYIDNLRLRYNEGSCGMCDACRKRSEKVDEYTEDNLYPDYAGEIPQQGTKERGFYDKAIRGDADAQLSLAYSFENKKNYTDSAYWYRKAAEQGYATAQCNLGYCYERGEGVERNTTEAVKWYRKAAEQGYATAQFNLGYCYEIGEGVEKNLTKAVNWYRKAAEQGYERAQFNLAIRYENGEGVEKNLAKSVNWYRKAAGQGLAEAQFKLGYCYENGEGVEKNLTKAVNWYRKAAEQGYERAQCNLGYCYGNGEGVERNTTEAVKWYRKAAEQGYATAQFNLGYCYEIGEGVEKNLTKAVNWYRKAAEQGYERAQFNLAIRYENGEGVEKNLAKSVNWYRKAAGQGLAEAQFNLGYCYENGEGVEKNLAKSVNWYRKAAEQGLAEAQFNLGYCYKNGQGVEKDLTEAVKWYRKAAEQGDEDAKKALRRLGYSAD